MLDQIRITCWSDTNLFAFVMHFQGSLFGEHLKDYELQLELGDIYDPDETRHFNVSVWKQKQEQFVLHVIEKDTYDVNPPRKYKVFHTMNDASRAYYAQHDDYSSENEDNE